MQFEIGYTHNSVASEANAGARKHLDTAINISSLSLWFTLKTNTPLRFKTNFELNVGLFVPILIKLNRKYVIQAMVLSIVYSNSVPRQIKKSSIAKSPIATKP